MEREIAENPTKLGIEELYPVIEVIQEKTDAALQELYERSAPQVSLKLPIESYIPDSSQRIEVQVVVTNRLGCSPAESLQLVVQEDPGSFCLDLPEVVLNRSLRGGDQQILRVSLRVTEDAIKGQAFSMPIYAQYTTRSSGVANTAVSNFSIRLYSEADFEPIPNLYAAHAEGGVVEDPAMFYGRDELIGNIAQAICSAPNQSKCVVVFATKRRGNPQFSTT